MYIQLQKREQWAKQNKNSKVQEESQNILFWSKLKLGVIFKLFKESDIIKRVIAEDHFFYFKLRKKHTSWGLMTFLIINFKAYKENKLT